MRHEKLEPHFEHAHVPGELLRQRRGGLRVGNVERRADAIHFGSSPPPSRRAIRARAVTSASGTNSTCAAPRGFHSTLPSASPFLPMAIRNRRPISSASLNFPPPR